ncbi:redox-sensing transcriptional repressor Rex [Sediminihabitans luteus]|uniref:redox-sensing transcriptional repressor Rex n=1 Tax=Sediminihabitans luteus TaxID=1138585 RepID=UPI0035712967
MVDVVPAPVPAATVDRLPSYLRALHQLVAAGVERTSSVELAELSGVGSAQLRKDLSFLGSFGTRGVGYDVGSLTDSITRRLGLETEHKVAIVGIGSLGQALANYRGYASRGFQLVALFDTAADVVGTTAGGLVVEHADDLAAVRERTGFTMVLLATPAPGAQEAVDRVVAAGVRSVLSFAPIALQVPEEVDVRAVDVGSELQILAFHSQARELRP